MNRFQGINARVNRWLTEPESNAAGRMSLFRIIYGLFYLWAIEPSVFFVGFSQYPPREWNPLVTFAWMGYPNANVIQVLAFVRIAALVLLIFGFRTRLATLAVLISGIYLHGLYYSFTGKIDHADTFLIAYIPMLMLFSRWDSNYSIESHLKRHKGQVDPKNSEWVYIWPMRIVIVLLAVMFFGAGYIKLRAGNWMTDMEHMSKILMSQNVGAIADMQSPNPINPIIAHIAPLSIALQMMGIGFELLFPLALVNRRFRTVFIATEVLFHAFNAIFLNINANMLLINGLLIVDWQALYERWWPHKLHMGVRRLPTAAILIGIIAIAIGAAFFWQGVNPLRPAGAWLNIISIHYVAAFIAGIALLRSGYGILQDALARIRSKRREIKTGNIAEQH